MKRIVEVEVDINQEDHENILLKQMDTTKLKIKILKNGAEVNLDGQLISMYFQKPNRSIVQQLAEDVDIENSVVTFELLSDCVRDYGFANIEIEIKDANNDLVSSFFIPIHISKTSKNDVSSQNTPNYFEEFSKGIEDLKKETKKIKEFWGEYEVVEEWEGENDE